MPSNPSIPQHTPYKNGYHIAVVDVGSPKQGNIGWCHLKVGTNTESCVGKTPLSGAYRKSMEKCEQTGVLAQTGKELDELAVLIAQSLHSHALVLGLEAPLFIPIRKDILKATQGRRGEGSRPWSAGAGAQVLVINLPVMVYLFKKILQLSPQVEFFLNETEFEARPQQIMVFEALVSGGDKGNSHVEDAEIMANYVLKFACHKTLPPSILQEEADEQFLNLVGCALLHCNYKNNLELLYAKTPIYKPSNLPERRSDKN